MSAIGQPERITQKRVIAMFKDELGYRYLGDWTDRSDNSNIRVDWMKSSPSIKRVHILIRLINKCGLCRVNLFQSQWPD